MAHPRAAEIDSDYESGASDPEEMDPSAFDFAQPQHGTLSTPSDPSSASSKPSTTTTPQPFPSAGSVPSPGTLPGQQTLPGAQLSEKERARLAREHQERTNHYQCLYPIYFDASRTRAEGRRVSKASAVLNPLAREIVDALQHVGNQKSAGFQIVFEPNKQHPSDWANPGRVRILVKKEGSAVHKNIGSKHQLYNLVAAYLKDHPTKPDDPMKLRLHGMPPMDEPPPPPAVPRGMKINSILPLHSPALTGGGVSENMFKDMMASMPGMEALAGAGGAGAGGPAGAIGAPAKTKDKKKK